MKLLEDDSIFENLFIPKSIKCKEIFGQNIKFYQYRRNDWHKGIRHIPFKYFTGI